MRYRIPLVIAILIISLSSVVYAIQPWANNATLVYTINITSLDQLNENYTIYTPINGSFIGINSTCTNMYVVYQSITEVDRILQGDCDTSLTGGELNVSFKMRPGTTIPPDSQNLDFSIWINATDSFVPSTDPHHVYAFYDNFTGSSLNLTKWDLQTTSVANCTVGSGLMTLNHSVFGSRATCQTNDIFDGNWTLKGNVSYTGIGNRSLFGFIEDDTSAYSGATRGAIFGPTSYVEDLAKWILITLDDVHGSTAFFNLSLNTSLGTFTELSLTKNGTSSLLFSNETVERNLTDLSGNQVDFTDSVIDVEVTGTNGGSSIQFDWLSAQYWVQRIPTVETIISNVVSLISPSQGSIQNGVNINFSCSGQVISAINNITNFTIRNYNPDDTLNIAMTYNQTDFNYSAQVVTVSNITNLTIDGVSRWNCEMTDTSNTLTRVGNSTYTVDSGTPTITTTQPRIEGNLTNMSLVYALNDASDISCAWSISTSANQSIGCQNDGTTNTTTRDVSGLGINYGVIYDFIFYANDTAGNNNSLLNQVLFIERVSQQYSPNVLETATEQFNLTVDDPLDEVDSATLTYNGGDTLGTLIDETGDNKTYQALIDVGPATIPSVQFNWTITGLLNGTTDTHVYSSENQTTTNVTLARTTGGNGTCLDIGNGIYALNFTFKDEDTNALLDIGFNVTSFYNVWVTKKSNALNFSWNESHTLSVGNRSHLQTCLHPNYTQLNSDFKLTYGGEGGYAEREFNLQNQVLNNQTQNHTLYMATDSSVTSITINVVDSNGIELEKYLVKAFLRDFSSTTDPLLLVDSQETDFNGQVVMDLDSGEYYQFEIWKDGSLVHTIEPFIIQTTTITIVVPLDQIFDTSTATDVFYHVTGTLEYNNQTGNVTGTWNDPSNLVNNICLKTVNITAQTINAFTYECSATDSGSLQAHIGTGTGTNFVASLLGQSNDDNNYYPILEPLTIDLRDDYGTFGLEAIFWIIIVLGTLSLLVAPSISTAIIVGVAVLAIVGYVLNIVSLPWTVLAGVIFVAGVLLFLLRE